MIRFAYFSTRRRHGEYTWSDLKKVAKQLCPGPGHNIYELGLLKILRNFGEQWGYYVIDELSKESRVVLQFESPEKELMFKLKYL